MTGTPVPPLAIPVSPSGQWIMTVGCLLLAGVSAAVAVRLARRERSSVPLLLLVTVALGSLLEPIYDSAFHILWFVPGQWNLYTAFDIPQPVWIWAAYLGCYGNGALYAYARARAGAGPRDLLRPAAVTFVGYVLFEVVGVNLGTYVYYGSHPFRLFGFPVWVTLINLAISFVAGVAAALAQRHARGVTRAAAACLAFPLAFPMVAFGAGFPTLDVISAEDSPTVVTHVAAVLTTMIAAAVIWLTARLLPLCATTDESSDGRILTQR